MKKTQQQVFADCIANELRYMAEEGLAETALLGLLQCYERQAAQGRVLNAEEIERLCDDYYMATVWDNGLAVCGDTDGSDNLGEDLLATLE
jgi:hypothetical protein